MATVTLKRRTRKPAAMLIEEMVRGSSRLRVDREKGIIFGVKIIGRQSKNSGVQHGVPYESREYTDDALIQGKHFYEGLGVYKDHPTDASGNVKPTAYRKVEDRFGWLQDVTIDSDGAFGNLHVLNPKTELAESIFAAAERKPDLFCLSHNAQGDGEVRNGVLYVTELLSVRSVDIVTEGGTVSSLFESRAHMKTKTIRQLVEAYRPKTRYQASLKRDALRICEMDHDKGVGQAAIEADEELDHKDHMLAAYGSLAKKDKLTEDEHDMMNKLHGMCKPALEEDDAEWPDKGAGGKDGDGKAGEIVAEDDEDDKEKDEEKSKKDGVLEKSSKTESRLAYLERKDKARVLCESAGVNADNVLLDVLADCTSESKMKALIEREKGRPSRNNAPRSGPSHSLPESRTVSKNRKEFLSLIGVG